MGVMSLWLSSGCVLKGQHEIVRVQLEATRTALSARAVDSQREIQDLEDQLAERDRRLDELGVRLDQLATLSELSDQELERVVAEQVALADELVRTRADLEQRTAEVIRLEARERRRRREPDPENPDPEADPEPPTPGEAALATLQARVKAQLDEELRRRLDDEVHEALRASLRAEITERFLAVERTPDATVVRVETRRLFQEGWTTLSPRGQQLVQAIATALRKLPGHRITVEGHTDDVPRHSAQFPSNWERGFGRAVTVLRGLTATAPHLHISAASFAATRPLVADDADDRNRRVEIWIRSDPNLVAPPAEPASASVDEPSDEP